MKIVRPIIALIVLLIVFGGGFLIQRQRDQRRSVLSGTFESQPALLSSRVAGRVKKLIAQEGDLVHAGQELALLDAKPDVLDTSALQAQVSESEQAYREAELSQAEQIAEQSASVDELRAALVKEINGPRPEEVQAGRAALTAAQNKYAEARNGNRPQEIGEAKAAYQAAVATLERVQRGATPEERAKARADLNTAKAQEEESRLASVRREWLFEEGAISSEVRDNAKSEYDAAVGRRQAAEQTLANLNSRPEDIALAEHQAAQSREHLLLLQAGTRTEEIGSARAARDQAAANLKLLLIGNRPEDIEQARAKLAQAEDTLEALKNGSRNNTVAQARLKVQQSEDTARSAKSKTFEQTIQAVRTAVVERSLVAEGELLSIGEPIFRVSYPDDLYLRIYVPEQALAHIHARDAAEVHVDGVGDAVRCVVESISTQGEFTPANIQTPEERGKQVFSVRLRPAAIDLRLKSGMSATILRIGDWTPQ